jgi:hypothetical protein
MNYKEIILRTLYMTTPFLTYAKFTIFSQNIHTDDTLWFPSYYTPFVLQTWLVCPWLPLVFVVSQSWLVFPVTTVCFWHVYRMRSGDSLGPRTYGFPSHHRWDQPEPSTIISLYGIAFQFLYMESLSKGQYCSPQRSRSHNKRWSKKPKTSQLTRLARRQRWWWLAKPARFTITRLLSMWKNLSHLRFRRRDSGTVRTFIPVRKFSIFMSLSLMTKLSFGSKCHETYVYKARDTGMAVTTPTQIVKVFISLRQSPIIRFLVDKGQLRIKVYTIIRIMWPLLGSGHGMHFCG